MRYSFYTTASSEEEILSICKLVESKGFSVTLIDREWNDPSDKPPAGEPYGPGDSDYSFHGAKFFVAPKNVYDREGISDAISYLRSQG